MSYAIKRYPNDRIEFDGLLLFDPTKISDIANPGFCNTLAPAFDDLLESTAAHLAELAPDELGMSHAILLTYGGFITEEDSIEVRSRTGNTAVIHANASYANDSDLTRTGAQWRKGEFVYRIGGRARAKQASFYTPRALTDSACLHTIQTRLESVSCADEILTLTILEPSMGTGPFLIRAISILAKAYLVRKQKEVGGAIPPETLHAELVRVKQRILAHNTYGCDIDELAVHIGQMLLVFSCYEDTSQDDDWKEPTSEWAEHLKADKTPPPPPPPPTSESPPGPPLGQLTLF